MTRVLLACAASLVLASVGCGVASSSGETPSAPSTLVTPGRSSQPAVRAAPPSCPAQIFARMTMAQRIGQLFLVGMPDNPDPQVALAVSTYHFGSWLFDATSTVGVAQTLQVTQAVQALATAGGTSDVRFFLAANQEGGEIQQLSGPGFAEIPPALAQGTISSAALQQQAAAWGSQLRSAGVNLNLAPVMDVVPLANASQNAPIGMLQREFGYTPAVVAAHGVAFIRGMGQAGVATTAKHFPGLGQVRGNTDFSAGVVDTNTGADSSYLQSFQAAIAAGVPFVMVALATYTRIDPDHLAAFSPQVMQVMLRQQLGFNGVIVSDDLGAAAAVAGVPPGTRAVDFLAAGGDLITSESLAAAGTMDAAVLAEADADPAFRSGVDSAVMRVLAAKQAYGLLPCAAG